MLKKPYLLLSIGALFFSTQSFAKLKLEDNRSVPYSNRNHIDTATGFANLNFIYTGCDKNPSKDNIQLVKNGDCRAVKDYNLGVEGTKKSISGQMGEIIASYQDPKGVDPNCTDPVEKKLHTSINLRSVYQKFKDAGCTPAHLLISDGTAADSTFIDKAMGNKRICELPDVPVSKKGFPTEDNQFFNLKFNDNTIKVGDHTKYSYDHGQKHWCLQYKEKEKRCGSFPSPLMMAYKGSTDNRYHLKGTINLHADGTASIRAIDKSFDTSAEIYEAQKNGQLTDTNTKLGRIDFDTYRKPNGLIRSIVRSYDEDTKYGLHQRAVHIIGRNMLGIGVTNSWCEQEHCFQNVTSTSLLPNKCDADNKLELTNGGSGNACHSCIGISPGLCAIEKEDVVQMKKRLDETDDFKIYGNGEYKMGPEAEKGLLANYTKVIKKPKKPGCYPGHAPAYNDKFRPQESEQLIKSNGARNVQSTEKKNKN